MDLYRIGNKEREKGVFLDDLRHLERLYLNFEHLSVKVFFSSDFKTIFRQVSLAKNNCLKIY